MFLRVETSCSRCHRAGGEGGTVGPDLGQVGAKGRDHILESILQPAAKIAEGFENITVIAASGEVASGVRRPSDDGGVRLVLADGTERSFAPQEITEATVAASSAPAASACTIDATMRTS